MKPAFLLGLLLTGSVLAQEAAPRPAPRAFEKGKTGTAAADPFVQEAAEANPFEDVVAASKMVRVTVEFFEVSAQEANRLLYVEKLGKDGVKLRQALQQMLGEGKASEFETMSVLGRSGEKSSTESIAEQIYPTEYEPANCLPPQGGTAEQADPLKEPKKIPNCAVPTAFETRNTGSMLEVEPTLNEGDVIIDVRLAPEIVLRAADSKSRLINFVKDKEEFVEMPMFYSLRTKTAVTLSDGAPLLVSTLTPMAANGTCDRSKKLLVMVTGDVITVKPAKK